MGSKAIAVLGGGWGGLSMAHALRDTVPDDHRVVVVERRSHFALCVSYLWLMTGEHPTEAAVRRELSNLARPGIEWLQATVTRIDPESRRVETDSGPVDADYLVIALGAELAPDTVPGLRAHSLNLYEPEGALAIRERLSALERGRVVVVIARTPFRCPAAPYEAALLAESMLRKRGVRDRFELSLYTPEKQPMPVAGPEVGAAVSGMLSQRGIDYRPGQTLAEVNSQRVVFTGEEVGYDVLISVPPHRAPAAVTESGLTDGSGYVPVHPATLELLGDAETLETKSPGTYAIGDVAAIRLLNQMLLPKAGVFAEAQARVVAANIADHIRGQQPGASYDGRGFCYLEVGDGLAAYSAGDFYAFPAPRVILQPPAAEYKAAKKEIERVLDTWFRPPASS